FFKSHRPIEWRNLLTAPGVSVEVVDEIAAPDDQHSLVAQTGESLCSVVVEARGLRFVDAELYDGDIRLRKDVAEHRPGPVIQSPPCVQSRDDWRKQISHATRKL